MEEYQNGDNPFLDSFVVTFKDLSLFDETVTQLEAIEHVDSVEQDGGIAEMLLKVRHIVLIAGGWIIGMLLLVSLFIIANTIKLTVYSRRLEISIMKAVGATNAFVRMPFIIEGMVLGLVAGGVPMACCTSFMISWVISNGQHDWWHCRWERCRLPRCGGSCWWRSCAGACLWV